MTFLTVDKLLFDNDTLKEREQIHKKEDTSWYMNLFKEKGWKIDG